MNPAPCPWGRLRIEKSEVYPISYNLIIQVNVTTYVYNGTVEITIQTLKNLDFLTLNAASMLSTDLISITGPTNEQVNGQMFRYKPQDYVVIQFDKTLPPAKYVLKFNFKGSMLEAGLSGLYLSNYTTNTESGSISTSLGVTQFEFYDARKVIVSFDGKPKLTDNTLTSVFVYLFF